MSIIRAQLVGDVVNGSTFAGIVTATGFNGNVTGNVTGNLTGNVTGNVTGNLTGNVTGNITGNGNIGILTVTTVSAASSTGNNGQYLQSTGIGVTWSNLAPGISPTDSNVIGYNQVGIRSDNANGRLAVFGAGNFRVYRTTGTFTVEPGISSIRVRVIGAGGNGGNGIFSVSPTNTPLGGTGGGGGGGGGYAQKVITDFPAPRFYFVTVGASGGGTSSFGSEVSATGGTNAFSITNGVGGSGVGGDVNYSGAPAPASPAPGCRPGGASGTQLGNASGSSVPGIPNVSFPVNGYSVRRFPFDTFEGYNGTTGGNGYEGGAGGSGPGAGGAGGVGGGGAGGTVSFTISSNTPGGAGGIGGGGGGAGAIAISPPIGSFPTGAVPGPGGPGLVIVEW